MAGTGSGQRGVSRATSWRRKVEEIRQTARFGGFPIPEDLDPTDVLLDELKVSTGFCIWIESKLGKLEDELIALGKENIDDKGGMQVAATNEAGWIAIWQAERKHRAVVAKMCLDAGVAQRQIDLAEKQADLMFSLINEAFSMLRLTPEQERNIPEIMPALIRRLAIPGEVMGHGDA